jgi:hypothetical protein
MTKFNCIIIELYCPYCNNNSFLEDREMCDYCYDDMSLKFECVLCKTHHYYNDYDNNPTICFKYINSMNLIKKSIKHYIFRKKINKYYDYILDDYYNPKSKSLIYKVNNFNTIFTKPILLYIDSNIQLKTLKFQ